MRTQIETRDVTATQRDVTRLEDCAVAILTWADEADLVVLAAALVVSVQADETVLVACEALEGLAEGVLTLVVALDTALSVHDDVVPAHPVRTLRKEKNVGYLSFKFHSYFAL